MMTKSKIKISPAHRDSGNSNLGDGTMGLMGVMGVVRLMVRKHKSKNTPAQRDSKMSNGRLSGVVCRQHRQKGIFTMQVKNICRCFMGRRGNEPMSKMENSLPQRYSRMSNLKIEPENSFPQRHSGMSKLPGVRMKTENRKNRVRPAQLDSEMSNFGMGLIGPIGLMGRKPEMKSRPAQLDSGNSILKNRPYCPSCPYCPSVLKTRPAQRDSGISKLGLLGFAVQQPFSHFQALASESIPYIVNRRHIEDAWINSLLIMGKEKLTCKK